MNAELSIIMKLSYKSQIWMHREADKHKRAWVSMGPSGIVGLPVFKEVSHSIAGQNRK